MTPLYLSSGFWLVVGPTLFGVLVGFITGYHVGRGARRRWF